MTANSAPLLDINPRLDRGELRKQFDNTGRLQIRDFLTESSAAAIRDVLIQETPWGLAYEADSSGPKALRQSEFRDLKADQSAQIQNGITARMQEWDYAFVYNHYPMVDAYLGRWAPNGGHDQILEHINNAPFLDLIRAVTGFESLFKADAQATVFAPNQFLATHDDGHVAKGWKIAYVMHFCPVDWRPDWGGYLLFYNEDGDVTGGFRPRFNALNLFAVPQAHSVSYVPPFAPVARFAITGWFRDK